MSSDRKLLLERLSERLEEAVFDPDTAPRDLSPLTRRLADVAKELEDIRLMESREDGVSVAADAEDERF